MRAMISWAKVPGQSTWDTRPLAHASWAVSFLPLSNISFAWKEKKVYFHVYLLSDWKVKKKKKKDFILPFANKTIINCLSMDYLYPLQIFVHIAKQVNPIKQVP